ARGRRFRRAAGRGRTQPGGDRRATAFEQRGEDFAGRRLVAIPIDGEKATVASFDDDGAVGEGRGGVREGRQRFAGDGEFHQTAAGFVAAPLSVAPAFADEVGGGPFEDREFDVDGKLKQRQTGGIGGGPGAGGDAPGEGHCRDLEAG